MRSIDKVLRYVIGAQHQRTSPNQNFVDRQKVNRKIKQAKRALEVPELDETERKQLQDVLLAHRVDLNYILVRHIPPLLVSSANL